MSAPEVMAAGQDRPRTELGLCGARGQLSGDELRSPGSAPADHRDFLAHNTYPIARSILIEDSASPAMARFIRRRFGQTFQTIILNDAKLGQITSIDRAYQEIRTPYVFHCEDDWEFVRGGFIERSFDLLDQNPHIINVWLRGLYETSGLPVDPEPLVSVSGIPYHRMALDQKGTCQGFTFNPTLKRMADYALVRPLAALGSEGAAAQRYRELGFYAVTLDDVYVRHIGQGRHIPLPGDRRYLRSLKLRLRNLLHKHLHLRQP
jgi:hypothetical protein